MNIEHERTNDPPVSASREMVWSNVFLITNPRLADDRSAPGVFCKPSRVIQNGGSERIVTDLQLGRGSF